ncbi:ABC transporter substrate-binding protein [Cellulomonas endophytica]|uniref:ABC transporter substrate-binding protein n=1 Tax=Cellulomonas endophytica TaxID=2494735 RepID=UPI00101097AB|nr:extracellular solute-binding protein [Cellulomonas endophytica]
MTRSRSVARRAAVPGAAALVLGLVACSADGGSAGADAAGGASSGEPVELTMAFWGDADLADRYRQATDLFSEENPGVTVQSSFSSWVDYWPARATEAAARALPDVVHSDLQYLQEYGGQGSLLDLGPYVEDGTIDLEGWDETLVGAGEVDGTQVAVPIATNTLGVFQDPVVLAEAGVEPLDATSTWQDYLDLTAAVSAAGLTTAEGQPVYGSVDVTRNLEHFMLWRLQQGTPPFDADGTRQFDADDIVEWLELTGSQRADGAIYPAARATAVSPALPFTTGELAVDLTWSSYMVEFSAATGRDDLQLVPVPLAEDGERHTFLRPAMMFSASAATEHPQEAAELVDFLLNDERVGAIFGTARGVPADPEQRDQVEAPEGSVDARLLSFMEEVTAEGTDPVPVYPQGFGSLAATWRELSEEVNYGQLTPAELAEQFLAEAELVG